MKYLSALIVCALVAGWWLATPTPTARAEFVDVEMALLIDVSGSISGSEYEQQVRGYAKAILDPDVLAVIDQGTAGKIALKVVLWSDFGPTSPPSFYNYTDWMVVGDTASAQLFAAKLINPGTDSIVDPINDQVWGREDDGGKTGIGEVLTFAETLFVGNGLESDRGIIDISSNGIDNIGTISSSAGRDTALANVEIDTINAIILPTDGYDDGTTNITTSVLVDHFTDNVIGGDSPFLLVASGSQDLDVFKEKLLRELTPIPEPSSLAAITGLVLAGGAGRWWRRRKRAR